MSISPSPLSERALRLALALVATIALGALAACGDDEEDTGGKPQSLSIEMSEPGTGKYKFTVPQSVKGGLV